MLLNKTRAAALESARRGLAFRARARIHKIDKYSGAVFLALQGVFTGAQFLVSWPFRYIVKREQTAAVFIMWS